jgi:hypothetical protein
MQRHILFEQTQAIHNSSILNQAISVRIDKDGQSTHMRPRCLLNSKDPRSPPILIHTNPLEILDLDLMERPVERDFQLDL